MPTSREPATFALQHASVARWQKKTLLCSSTLITRPGSLARSLASVQQEQDYNFVGMGGTRCACVSRKGVFKKLWRRKTLGPDGHEERRWAEVGLERGFNQRSPDRWVCRCLINCIRISSALPRAGQEENFLYTFYRGRKRRFSSY